eukprot:gnl/TRDRNA2_/TRDRNA2_48520_c0_seq1.p1 gnl/TRDRNA2_/TRDRNA2_48520_c0~~gnl/TRDRNA2_/TRDRNA2_48520_c0_seq1.p1  ORF type:complete len:403 (+),score=54.52 gnl/TRDRNA2_/TRDRNA2_48520_c0_seq1:108-1316(+)
MVVNVLPVVLADRVAGALWGMVIADALASPSHRYMGGRKQIREQYGQDIDGYLKPNQLFYGSMMGIKNPSGRADDIIGSFINFGKKHYWQYPGNHYHCTLEAGENTLEGHMARLSMRFMAEGDFDHDRMQKEYFRFMSRPGTHNDCYACPYHRVFFRNHQIFNKPLSESPGNDMVHCDGIDGLVMPVPVILGTLSLPLEESIKTAQSCVSVTRRSPKVEKHIPYLTNMLRAAVSGEELVDVAQQMSQEVYESSLNVSAPDPVVASFMYDSFKAVLLFIAKYPDFEELMLANANAGGENVHRGMIIGALAGAKAGANRIPRELREGLRDADRIAVEIDEFVNARILQVKDTDPKELVGRPDFDGEDMRTNIAPVALVGLFAGSGIMLAVRRYSATNVHPLLAA